jgi:hypothetical protein
MSDIGKNLLSNTVVQSKKKKTLNLTDFKKFKYIGDISSRYILGKVLG